MLFIVFALGGCLDDKTNLNYTNPLLPDSVFVTNVRTGARLRCVPDLVIGNYSVKPGEELQLDVETFYRGDDEITYEWRFEKEIISTEQNLRHSFTKDGSIILLVFRKNAGNAVYYSFSVKMREPFATGVFVLAKDKGVTTLDFVERYYEKQIPVDFAGTTSKITLYQFVEYNDVYAIFNENAPLECLEPIKLFRYSGLNYDAGILRGLQILDKNWQNSVTINSDNIMKIATMKDEFVTNPQNLQPIDFTNTGAMNLLLDKSGKIYSRANYDFGNPCTGKYTTMPLTYNDPYDIPDAGAIEIKADQFFSRGSEFTVIYEKERKRFLVMTAGARVGQSYDYYYVTDFSRPVNNLPVGYVDLNHFDKELISVIMPQYSDVYFLFKNGVDYYLQPCGMDVQTYNVPHKINVTAKANVKLSPEIARLLAVGGNRFWPENNILYFSSGNTIYSMDFSGNQFKKIFEFQQKDKITRFAIMMPWHEGSASAVNRYYNGRVFCAAFENGDFKVVKMYDDPEKPGEVQYKYWVDKQYDGGIADVFYYQN